MRTASDRSFRPDWTEWANQNRIEGALLEKPKDEFDIELTGPWLDRWREQDLPRG